MAEQGVFLVTLNSLSLIDTKVGDLRKRLRALAFEKGPEAQLPTVRELCQLFNTSRVTLDETLDILTAENILYRKRRQGIFVSPHIYHKSIGILFDASLFLNRTISPFWDMLWSLFASEIQRRAAFKDEFCTFHLSNPQLSSKAQSPALPEEVISMIQSERIHGILAVGLNAPGEQWMANQAVPYVVFAGGGVWRVEINSDETIRLAITALIEQGCKKIGMWAPHDPRAQYQNGEPMMNYAIVQETLTANKIPYYPELIRMPRLTAHAKQPHFVSNQEQGFALASEVFDAYNTFQPDGLFIADDMLTDGSLVALEKLGVRIGVDVKIVTHANLGSPILFGRTENMMVLQFDSSDLVRSMFAQLDILMAGQLPSKQVIGILPRWRS